MGWNQQMSASDGAVFFRGSLPPKADEFAFLSAAGITSSADSATGGELWAVRLTHPTWGTARMSAPRQTVPIPKPILKYDARLEEGEKAHAALGRSSVRVRVEGDRGDVLRDRKRLLRFMAAVLGDDGRIALDATAMRFWSSAALADELCHDADLDIDSLFTVHAVTENDDLISIDPGAKGRPCRWYHTHGLAEIGFFDFDVLRPSPDLLTARCHDFARAVAFAIVEGKVQPSTPVAKILSNGPVRLVDVAEFNRRGRQEDRALRDLDVGHNRNRTVLCDPVDTRWWHRFTGTPARASRLLSADQGEFMVYFPTNASRLMARRARQTYGRFRQLAAEYGELQVKPIVKLGYRVDGGDETDLEHMWFEVHSFGGDTVNATLMNDPFHVASLKKGDRRDHPIERLTDWALIGPTGMITPRDTRPARSARLHRDAISAALAGRK